MSAVSGWKADVWVTASPSIPVANESTTYTQVGVPGLYTCTFKTDVHKFWDKNSAYLVEQSTDGTTWTPANQLIRYFHWVSGIFELPFDLPGEQLRFSGSYFSASQVEEAHTWELSVIASTQNTTTFRSPWQKHT